ncbi:leucine-rich repeat domain-containing protein [Echinicola shivajiensis]|uniref:hypothetical protein n=1 Tax=Echinicola shivajiensis TaxID=1035916 RepID=UPI001BFC4B90|nr:hypothetical protein [Echinicola shivajiensis]
MGLFKKEKKWGNFGGNINVYSDLKESDIERLINEPNIHSLQFYEFKTPSTRTWNVLEKFFNKYPQIRLHIFWYEEVDFKFLEHLPSIKRFAVSSYLTTDFSAISKYLDLEDLSLGETKSTSINVDFISTFKNLKRFYNDGMKKGLEALSSLTQLEVLTLRGVKMADLKFVENLQNLKELNLLFGSYKDLSSISKLKQLEELEISRTRQIPDYDFLSGLINLKTLCFEGMSKMEVLPNLSSLKNLNKIQIENNSRLVDIRSIEQLESLKTFLLFFPENFKAASRKELMIQATDILKTSQTIKSTNLWRLMDETDRSTLKQKGIEFWGYNPEVEKIFNK